MKITICQINTITADLEGNINRCMAAIEQAAAQKPDLIVLPEMAICGINLSDIFYDTSFMDASFDALNDLALECEAFPPVLVGHPVPTGDIFQQLPKYNNSAFLLKDGYPQLTSQQEILWDFDINFESRWFTPGTKKQIITIAGYRIMPLVGKDFFHPEELLKTLPSDFDLLIGLTNTPYYTGSLAKRVKILKDWNNPVIQVNQVGGFEGVIFDGRSLVYQPGLKEKSWHLPAFSEKIININFPNIEEHTALPKPIEEERFQALTLGIQDFFQKNKMSNAYFGLSGGIDSAVTAVLTQKALGKDHVTALILPTRFNDPQSAESAKQLAKSLNINVEEVNLEPFLSRFEKNLPDLMEKEIVSENVQARLRAIILMAFVNFHGGVLLNTSNKTELSLGYGTLYGDLAGSLAPIGDLTKMQVYDLARWINRTEEIIPQFIINRKPSAELKPGQVDPFDYPKVSPILENLIQTHQSNPILRSSEHKRHQFGTILKVSETAFGLGRIIPITRK